MKTRQHCCSEVWFVSHMQEFDSVVPRIDEHIDTTIKRVFPHLRTDKSTEGVKALTHIGRLRPEPISETVVQAKHCPRWCEASPRWNSLLNASPPRTMSWPQSSSIPSARMLAYALAAQQALRLSASDRKQTLSEWTDHCEVPFRQQTSRVVICRTAHTQFVDSLFPCNPVLVTVTLYLDYLLFRYFQCAFHPDVFFRFGAKVRKKFTLFYTCWAGRFHLISVRGRHTVG